jgi:hypothetical protein
LAFGSEQGLFSDERDLTEAIEQELATSDRWAERSDPQADALQKKLAVVRKKREDAERFEKEFGAAASDLVRRIKEEEDELFRECFAQRPSTPERPRAEAYGGGDRPLQTEPQESLRPRNPG